MFLVKDWSSKVDNLDAPNLTQKSVRLPEKMGNDL